MSDKIASLHGEDAGVVAFGVRIPGYTAVVDGHEIPRLMVYERGQDQITIVLDRRFAIDVPRNLSGAICWMIANGLAIGEGYSHLGAPNKDRPFAPKVIGGFGRPDITGGGAWPDSDGSAEGRLPDINVRPIASAPTSPPPPKPKR